VKLEELFDGGTPKMQKRKKNTFFAICVTAALLVLTLVVLAISGIVIAIGNGIEKRNAELSNVNIGKTTVISIVDSKLHTGSLLILDDNNKYVGAKPKLENMYSRTDRVHSVLRVNRNNFMATNAAASALNKMLSAFKESTGDDNVIVSNAYDQSKSETQSPIFATGETFELMYFHDFDNLGTTDQRTISGVELYSWIYENAYKYGFISIGDGASATFRYVGTVHSTAMKEKDLSFTEYLNMLKEQTTPASPLTVISAGNSYAVYYLSHEGEHTVPLNYKYDISGNNIDGYIITVNVSKKIEN